MRRPALGTVAIVGTGLIGASIGLALRRSRACERVVGWDRAPTNARLAKRRKAIDVVARSLDRALRGASIIIIAVPLDSVKAILRRIRLHAPFGSLILDTAPLKSEIMAIARDAGAGRQRAWFVGGHPLAGSERQGPMHASATLFADRTFFLCWPVAATPGYVRRRAADFVRALSAAPIEISARRHDRIVAYTSALPQLVASTLALAAGEEKLHRAFAGPGFADTTRLALTAASFWTGNLVANKTNVGHALRKLECVLKRLRVAIQSSDRHRLERLLRGASAARRRLA